MSDMTPYAELLQSYGRWFDARDAPAFASLFTTDATIVVPGGKELVGRERVTRMVEKTPPGGSHEIGVPQLIEKGDSTVTTRTTFSAVMADGTQMSGSYDNTFSLTPDGWRISRHEIHPDQ